MAQSLKRNPVTIALGAYISAERQKTLPNLTSSKVAQKLKMTESLFRMIESGNARIHPKYVLKFISVFKASHLDYGAFCRLLISIQFLDNHLETLSDFTKALIQLEEQDARCQALIQSMQPLIKAVMGGETGFKEIFQSGKIIDSVREYLTNPETEVKKTAEIQLDRLAGIFSDIPTIYYSFIDKTVRDLMTLPLGFRSIDLWKWEKNNRFEFKSLFAIVKDVKSIISEDNFRRYKYEYLWSPNFIEAHIIFIGQHNVKKLRNDFARFLKNAIHEGKEPHLLQDIDEKLNKLILHSIELTKAETDEIFVDVAPEDPIESTEYELAWVFELQHKTLVGLKAKVIRETWKLQEGISLTWDKTTLLYEKMKMLLKMNHNNSTKKG